MNDYELLKNDHRFSDASRAPKGEDLLPPVEAPSAGFIVQLFVVPALIVMLIVGVWLTFSWLVRRTSTDPKDLIQGLEQGPSIARWQRASELADMLHNKRFPELKQDSESAGQLAGILSREIDRAGMEDDEVEFRKYLARALGEFEVQDGTDVLLKAAATNRDPREQKVRDGALQAIAVRAYTMRQLAPPQELEHPELESTLLALAADPDPVIRVETAYALGHLGTPAAIERLEVMVDDPDADTRYNAAVALAHRGNAKAVETLAEMLEPKESQAAKDDENEQEAQAKREVIMTSSMKAATQLAQKNPSADLTPVIEQLEQLAKVDAKTSRETGVSLPIARAARRSAESLKTRRHE